jgi:hypothetical protein
MSRSSSTRWSGRRARMTPACAARPSRPRVLYVFGAAARPAVIPRVRREPASAFPLPVPEGPIMSITVHDDVPVSTDQGLDGPQPADPETARVLMVFSDATKATNVLRSALPRLRP